MKLRVKLGPFRTNGSSDVVDATIWIEIRKTFIKIRFTSPIVNSQFTTYKLCGWKSYKCFQLGITMALIYGIVIQMVMGSRHV